MATSTEKIYLDSNIFIYAFLDDGEKGAACRALLQRIEDGMYEAVTATLTFDEVVWIVGNDSGHEEGIAAGELLLSMPGLIIESVEQTDLHTSIAEMIDYRLKPRDAIHLAIMKKKKITTIFAYDADFDTI